MTTLNKSIRRLITVTGPDRPGIVAAISERLAAEGADIEDISMTRLSGNFAMMMLVRGGAPGKLDAIREKMSSSLGMFIHIEPAVETAAEPEANVYVSASGPNRIGIVATLSKLLATSGANITEMTTRLLRHTAVPVYLVRIEATTSADLETLKSELAAAGDELGVEVRLESIGHEDL
jgi:glycine cleavage system transcriptional repressor